MDIQHECNIYYFNTETNWEWKLTMIWVVKYGADIATVTVSPSLRKANFSVLLYIYTKQYQFVWNLILSWRFRDRNLIAYEASRNYFPELSATSFCTVHQVQDDSTVQKE